MKQLKLPSRHKKQIMRFIERYFDLASPKTCKFIVEIKTTVVWKYGDSLCIPDINGEELLQKNKFIISENRKIKMFCKQVSEWGIKHFQDNGWVWEKVLWNCYPESGQKLKDLKIVWE